MPSEAQRRRPFLDQLVHGAGAGDDRALYEVVLGIAAGVLAGRAGPQCAAAGEEIVDQPLERPVLRFVSGYIRARWTLPKPTT